MNKGFNIKVKDSHNEIEMAFPNGKIIIDRDVARAKEILYREDGEFDFHWLFEVLTGVPHKSLNFKNPETIKPH